MLFILELSPPSPPAPRTFRTQTRTRRANQKIKAHKKAPIATFALGSTVMVVSSFEIKEQALLNRVALLMSVPKCISYPSPFVSFLLTFFPSYSKE